jgi:hypothetical protein
MEYKIPPVNWHINLSKAIKSSSDGDIIVCNTQVQAQLAARAKQRLCPNKQLEIIVDDKQP